MKLKFWLNNNFWLFIFLETRAGEGFHVKHLTTNKFIFIFVDFIKVFISCLFSFLKVFTLLYLLFNCYLSLYFSQKEIINTAAEIISKISSFILSWSFVVVFNKLILINQYDFRYIFNICFSEGELFFWKIRFKKAEN